MSDKAKVSIIIPCRNEEKSIKRCLESSLNQTYRKIQLIIIDSSNDETPEIIGETLRNASIVALFQHSDRPLNPSQARNIGLRLADGEIITFMDADTYAEPDYVEKAIKPFDKPQITHTCARLVLLPPKTAFGKFQYTYLKTIAFKPYADWPIVRGFYRRQVLETIGEFDESLDTYEDLNYMIRARAKTREKLMEPHIEYVSDAILSHDWEQKSGNLKDHFAKSMWYGAGLLKAIKKHPYSLFPRFLAVWYLSLTPLLAALALCLNWIAVALLVPYVAIWPYSIYEARRKRLLSWQVLAIPPLLVYKGIGHLCGIVKGLLCH